MQFFEKYLFQNTAHPINGIYQGPLIDTKLESLPGKSCSVVVFQCEKQNYSVNK